MYDALNVFSALNVVKKIKNKIMLSAEGAEKLKEGNQVWDELQAVKKPLPKPADPEKLERLKKLRVRSFWIFEFELVFI